MVGAFEGWSAIRRQYTGGRGSQSASRPRLGFEMDQYSSRRVDDGSSEHEDSDRERSGSTRRLFLKDVGKKALYVTPVIVTLSAQRAQASATQPSLACGVVGSPCTTDDDCCGCCDDMMNVCEGAPGCGQAGVPCLDDSECCSDKCDMMDEVCDAC